MMLSCMHTCVLVECLCGICMCIYVDMYGFSGEEFFLNFISKCHRYFFINAVFFNQKFQLFIFALRKIVRNTNTTFKK